MAKEAQTILTLNSGSSSLKFGLYGRVSDSEGALFSGSVDGVGPDRTGTLSIKNSAGAEVTHQQASFPSASEAFQAAVDGLAQHGSEVPAGIGHRIVHGGPHLRKHQALTADVLKALEESVHFAPLHIPPALALIRLAEERFPGVPQFACFDTAFHTTMPPEAFTYPIPERYRAAGVQRYGFHGLSYESIVRALEPDVPARLVVAHLGNGASLCAIAGGRSVDTSMGFTPTGGIPMGTRTGDLDPGVALFMQRAGQLDPDRLESVLNQDSGLKALSQTAQHPGTSDVRALTASAENGDAPASLALAIFARAVAKTIGAYMTVLGGLDLLVFTGGIGEHSAPVREAVCQRLAPFGLSLDPARNRNAHPGDAVTGEQSAIPARVLAAAEDQQIARHVRELLSSQIPERRYDARTC